MWSINVDENDPSSLKMAITKLQKRRKNILWKLGYHAIGFQGTTVHAESVMPLLERIIESDLSSVYGESSGKAEYYVYVHCDPTKMLNVRGDLRHLFMASRFKLKNVPFYVGKGVGSRCFDLNRNDGHRKIRTHLIKQKKEVEVVKVAYGLSEQEALSLESKLIDIMGIRHLSKEGLLINLDEGEKSSERRKIYGKEALAILKKNGFSA